MGLNGDTIILNSVSANLNYNNQRVERRKNGESIIIIPLQKPSKEQLNNKTKYLKLKENSILNLIIINSKDGKMRWSSIVAFEADNERIQSKLKEKTIQNILNNETVEDEGKFKFIDLKGRISYQLEYKNKKLYSYATPVSEDQLAKNSVQKQKNLAGKTIGASQIEKIGERTIATEICTNYYWVTTTYYDDGTVITTEEYLYTSCTSIDGGSGGGGGGGNGEPEEENDHEISIGGSIEFSEAFELDDIIEEDGTQNLDNGEGIISASLEPKPEFKAYWDGQRMALSRKIMWITMTDIVADPTNMGYDTRKGWVDRNVVVNTYGKWVTIHPPFRVTATLEWNYSALVRYTYRNTGISNTIPYVNRVHTKFIGPFTDF